MTIALHVFATLWVLGLFYRIHLTYLLLDTDAGTALVDQSVHSWPFLLRYAYGELLFAIVMAALVFGFLALVRLIGRLGWRLIGRGRAPSPMLARGVRWGTRLVGYPLLLVFLLALASMQIGHRITMIIMTSGLTYDVLMEGFASTTFGDSMNNLFDQTTTVDYCFLAAVPLTLAILRLVPPRVHRALITALAGIGVLAMGLNLIYLPSKTPPVVAAVRHTPLWFTTADVVAALRRPKVVPVFAKATPRLRAMLPAPNATKIRWDPKLPLEAQYLSVAFLHPYFVHDIQPKKVLPKAGPTKRWNVVLFLMESTGGRYVYDKDPDKDRYAMPFLRGLARQGLMLRQHFSPSNSSPRSIFSIFSGLNPMPELRIYAMNKGIGYPSLVTFFGPEYGSFLVTPASLRWYFPRHYFDRRGPQKIYDYYGVPTRRTAPDVPHARHEEDAVSFFIQRLTRLARQKKPFFATYYSFVAHWPYPDFGPRYHRFPMSRKRWRYLNNLYLLDVQIKRVYDRIAELKLLDDTIFIFVGDHGEAFGQHKSNWTHARHSYNENYQTPMIFWQPALFKPRVVPGPTSHIDILPTLLDAMGIDYNELLIQGESLFQDKLRREYIFLFGNEDTLSSVSHDGIKLQIAFKQRGKCWVYDLNKDPDEHKRLSCKHYQRQKTATLAYRKYQRRLLRGYNADAAQDRAFYGQTHTFRRAPVRR